MLAITYNERNYIYNDRENHKILFPNLALRNYYSKIRFQ